MNVAWACGGHVAFGVKACGNCASKAASAALHAVLQLTKARDLCRAHGAPAGGSPMTIGSWADYLAGLGSNFWLRQGGS